MNRRSFVKTTTMAGVAGLAGITSLMKFAKANKLTDKKNGVYFIGPMEGYSPQIGVLVSMLNYNRQTILNLIKSMTMEDLDYLHDSKANTIGALLLHLGAVEKYYQINSFEGRQEFNEKEKEMWDIPLNLGEEGRKNIKGHDLKYYVDIITEIRETTLEEFRKKDDEWLLAIDPEWSKDEPLNTYWKWFHVCEHESNHRGQMAWLKNRLPGAQSSKD